VRVAGCLGVGWSWGWAKAFTYSLLCYVTGVRFGVYLFSILTCDGWVSERCRADARLQDRDLLRSVAL